jgi:ABC-type spermidine/putrescine transport system permease subunit II
MILIIGVFTLSAADSKESAILSRLGDLPVYMYVNNSAITGPSTSLISTKFFLLSSILCSNMALNTGDRAANNDDDI